ncbi:MAG: hypothetical protein R3F30_04490 [Planctomycetota bacterium]
MIYGYDSRTVNEHGLREMREVSLDLAPDALRELAGFLLASAEELDGSVSEHWHRHAPKALRDRLGCDVVVLNGTHRPQAPSAYEGGGGVSLAGAVPAKDTTVRLSCEDIDLLLNALNEALEAVEDWEFSTRTGFEKSEFRAMQASLQAIRDGMGEDR